jgi:hypothetical protein
MRRLRSLGLLRRRDADDASDVVVELDRWQLTGLLLAVFVFCGVAFAIGLAVGRDSSASGTPPPQLTLEPTPAPATRDRQLSLAEAAPSMTRLQLEARRPTTEVSGSNPAELARIATHRALHEARDTGVGHLPADQQAPPVAPAQAALAEPAPASTPAEPPPAAHALAVATVGSEASAQAMKGALAKITPSGVPVRVRAVQGASGAAWRVEVGRFESAAEAATFQKRFQADSGYLVSVVAVP